MHSALALNIVAIYALCNSSNRMRAKAEMYILVQRSQQVEKNE